MVRILVAGGTGKLGRAVVNELQMRDIRVRVMSRRSAPAGLDARVEWAQADVMTGKGLEAALVGVDTIVNVIGDPQNLQATDVLGVKRLAEAAQQAQIRHFFHISIPGLEQVDYYYYRHKLDAEQAVLASGVPYSIQRVTQFHDLLLYLLSHLKQMPAGWMLPVASDALFQVIDTRDVARYIIPLLAEPAGRLPDVGGPEILRVDQLARLYLTAQGVSAPSFIEPETDYFPDTALAAFRQGFHTVPDNCYGQITWADYVREKFAAI